MFETVYFLDQNAVDKVLAGSVRTQESIFVWELQLKTQICKTRADRGAVMALICHVGLTAGGTSIDFLCLMSIDFVNKR